jgi:anaerobic magnesium-protoporphyrin IX monomethyl ester cyclase
MSSNEELSLLPIERVKNELERFIEANVRQVKFVDRTFNFPSQRAQEIIKALISLSDKYPDSATNFHIEITASLLEDGFISLLHQAKKGLIRLEAGVQSTNPDTLKAVNRSLDMVKLLKNLKTLCGMDNIRVHADLIAGLPLASYETFGQSFNDVYALQPDTLQLGFLKLLKGSPLREAAQKYGIAYTDYPPYEVLRTNDITYGELSSLHQIERELDLMYNSGLCRNALRAIIPSFASPFDFYEQFSDFLELSGYYPPLNNRFKGGNVDFFGIIYP